MHLVAQSAFLYWCVGVAVEFEAPSPSLDSSVGVAVDGSPDVEEPNISFVERKVDLACFFPTSTF